MNNLTDDTENILQENADLIHLVIMAVYDPKFVPPLEANLVQAEANGWGSLVAAIRKILDGKRDRTEFLDLDTEDQTIVAGILQGIEDASTLPDLANAVSADRLGPVIANLVYATRSGSTDAEQQLNTLATQLAGSGEELARVAMVTGLLLNGERNCQVLCNDMGHAGMSIIESILEELARLES